MKAFLTAVVLGAALALGGCASTSKPIGVDASAPAPIRAAQAAINESRLLIAAVADVVASQKRDNLITAAERDAYVAKLEDALKKTDEAEVLMKAGSPLAADRANIVKSLLITMQREIAARASAEKARKQ